MPVEIPFGFSQVVLKLQHVSGSHVGALVYGISSSSPPDDPIELADKQTQDYSDTIGVRTDGGVLIGPTIVRIGVSSGEPLSVEGTLQLQGDLSGNTVPSNCAALVKKQTTTGGRRGRGRAFLPWCLQEGDVDDVGVIDSGALAVIQGAADDWLGLLDSPRGDVGATPMYVLHNSEGETPAGDPSAVISLIVSNLIGSQRRRLGR